MSRRKAIEIVKNLTNTIATMGTVEVVANDQFPPARAKKSKLIKIAHKLVLKYRLNGYKKKKRVLTK